MKKWYVVVETQSTGIWDNQGEFVNRWVKKFFIQGDEVLVAHLTNGPLVDVSNKVEITCLEPDGSERNVEF